MVIFSLSALKKSSKKKEIRIKQEIVEVLQQASCRRKKTRSSKTRMMKLLALTLDVLARITRT